MAIIDGTSGNDELFGTDRADLIRGFAGNDEIEARDGSDELRGGSGNDEIDGDAGTDELYGGKGNDELDGGRGNDELTGGKGADTFEFERGDGRDVITDWGNSDRMDLDDFGYSSFRQVMRDATNVGGDVVFDFGSGNEVTVLDTAKSDFSASDFLLF